MTNWYSVCTWSAASISSREEEESSLCPVESNKSAARAWAPPPGGGGRFHQFEILGGGLPRSGYTLEEIGLSTCQFFRLSNIFETKWPKSEENLEFGGRLVWRNWIRPPPSQKFVAALLGSRNPLSSPLTARAVFVVRCSTYFLVAVFFELVTGVVDSKDI